MIKPRQANETLIFQHIPKTAGTTLSFILTHHFQEQDIYHVRNLKQMNGPAYSSHFGSTDNFIALHPDERNSFRLIIGHETFGLHRHLNHPVKYITFVRDPVERVISQYCQYRRMIKANELDDEQLTLEQFLALNPHVMNNYQTRNLSGLDFVSYTPKECYQKTLENIDQYFSFVGIVERFDESLLLPSKLFDWPRVTYIRRNTTTTQDSNINIDPATIQKIREANQLDTKLYRHAIRLLDGNIKLQGRVFDKELKLFKRRQALATTTHNITSFLHGLARRLIPTG